MKRAPSLLLAMAAAFLFATSAVHATTGYLKIHMLAAGDARADCFLIELPDNTKMVVDVADGYDTMLINKLNALGFGGGIKYLVGTHEHVDHIGGMDEFLDSGFNINNTQIYYPKAPTIANEPNYLKLLFAFNSGGLPF